VNAPETSQSGPPLTTLKRLLLFLLAVVCLSTAFVVVAALGLPERAEFTGRIIPGELPVAPEINAIAPAFEKMALDGNTVRLADLRGHPVLINFWATWCVPCRVEMPGLEATYEAYEAQGLRVLAVNLGEPADAVGQWVHDLGLTFDVLLDSQQSAAALYQIRGQPSTYVVSPEGMITQIFYGPTTPDSLKAAIAPFLSS
jgi:cytochrome c biogenesis protein CcmG/thiol:disulfide interchange protein DsbE